LKVDLGDVKGALEANEEKQKVDQKIAEMPFGGAETAVDVSERARLQKMSGDEAGALKTYRESLDIARREAGRHPYIVSLQARIATTSTSIGDLQLGSGDLKGAKKSYESAFAAGNDAAQLARITASIQYTPATENAVVKAYGLLSWLALLAHKPPQQAAKYANWTHHVPCATVIALMPTFSSAVMMTQRRST
jgi:hypothetical protein